MVGVAVVAHEVIDGHVVGRPRSCSGAVVSPTDPVAATAIASRVGAPRRYVTIVEGEALVNDATALVAYKFAVGRRGHRRASRWPRRAGASCSTRSSASRSASPSATSSRSCARRSTTRRPRSRSRSSRRTSPTCRPRRSASRPCWPPSRAGIYLGWRSPELITPATRIQAFSVWEILVFVLNAALFVLVGLQLPSVLDGISGHVDGRDRRATRPRSRAAVIVMRFLWVFPRDLPAARWLSRRVREREPAVHWHVPRHRGVDGHARRRVAGRGARHPADDRRRAAPSRSATSSSSSPTR